MSTAGKRSRVVVRLGGRTVLDIVADGPNALISVVEPTRPTGLLQWVALPLAEVWHRFQYRSWSGRRPASPIEQLQGEVLAVLVVNSGGSSVGVGFRAGDDIEIEVTGAAS